MRVMSFKQREKYRIRENASEERTFRGHIQRNIIKIINSPEKLPQYCYISEIHFPNYDIACALKIFADKKMQNFIKKLRHKGYCIYTTPERIGYLTYLRVFVEEYKR